MKLLPILIICYIMTMVCCTAKHADNSSDTSQAVATDTIGTLTNASMSTDTSSIVKSDDECFIAFIKRFHTDSTFQLQRVCDTVGYSNLEYYYDSCNDLEGHRWHDTIIVSRYNNVWTNKGLKLELHYYDEYITRPEFGRRISLISDTVINENIFIIGSGTEYTLQFTNKGHKWFLGHLYASVI